MRRLVRCMWDRYICHQLVASLLVWFSTSWQDCRQFANVNDLQICYHTFCSREALCFFRGKSGFRSDCSRLEQGAMLLHSAGGVPFACTRLWSWGFWTKSCDARSAFPCLEPRSKHVNSSSIETTYNPNPLIMTWLNYIFTVCRQPIYRTLAL
jgi:hypothetical protein